MRLTNRLPLLISLIPILFSGCSSSHNDTVTGKGSIRAMNAAPDIGVVNFMIEETLLGSLDFKEISGTSEYDDLQYNFNFDLLLPGDVEATRVLTHTLQVRTDQEYTFVLTGSYANPELFLWEQFGRDWLTELTTADENGTEVTVLEVSFGHVASNFGAVDVYLEAPGTSPEFATPRGSMTYGEFLSAVEISSGTYQLVLTEPGDPTTIVFASDPIGLNAAVSNLITIMDSGGTSTADISVRLMGQGVNSEIVDINLGAKFRVVHAAFGTDDVDLYLDGNFTTPVVRDLSFASVSDEIEVDGGQTNINITPAGNVGVFLEQDQLTLNSGSLYSMYLVGLPGDPSNLVLQDNQRRLANFAKFRIIQGAIRFTAVDIYLLQEGSDIGLVSPSISSILYAQNTGYLSVSPGTYDLTLTLPGSKTVIGGPYRMQLDGSGIYTVVSVEENDISMVDLVQLDDFLNN